MVKIVLLYLFCLVYAVVRYVWFTPANVEHLPVFVSNKGVAMGGAFCFVLAFWGQWRRRVGVVGGTEPAVWFRAGIFAAVAHVPMSLSILRPSYFAEFFAGERLSLNGEAILLFGALTAAGIYLLQRATWTAWQRWWLSLATMVVLFVHALAMGIARGFNINASHAYLPPMWLLSLIGIGLGLVFLLMDQPVGGAASERERAFRFEQVGSLVEVA
jgi:hypothetical protein